MIIRLSHDGKLTREVFPNGGMSTQNYEICRQIGNSCRIFEHVRPARLYSVIGCKPDPDPKHPGAAVSMLMDEEARLKPNYVNALASWLYGADVHGQPIAGNVIFVGEKYDEDGDLTFCDIDDNEFLTLFRKLSVLIEDNKKIVERSLPI